MLRVGTWVFMATTDGLTVAITETKSGNCDNVPEGWVGAVVGVSVAVEGGVQTGLIGLGVVGGDAGAVVVG